MKEGIRLCLVVLLSIFVAMSVTACNSGDSGNGGNGNSGNETYDVDANGIPQFVDVDYIVLDDIYQISKFRSGIGHDYSDDFETCRSMKHYFQPDGSLDWATVKIFSPVNGTISTIFEEWAGTQVQLKSKEYPAFFFIIFHVNLTNPLSVGDVVTAGQQLGMHIGSQTMSDIAVGVNTPNGWKLVSYFDVITNSVFQDYQERGLTSRNDVIISKELRDADSLICNGGEFEDIGNLENWATLN
ncbi:MAG: hypothetical protein E3J87_06060 [Candidatus Cloacimonadota bacterium]|nr:MAG: hypothetical protein E3J87_06060 [Candidatus Cloacimonadota bacterium]